MSKYGIQVGLKVCYNKPVKQTKFS
jgi:hypothetical protein